MAFIGRVFAVPAFSPPYKSWSTWTKQAENRPAHEGLGEGITGAAHEGEEFLAHRLDLGLPRRVFLALVGS